MPKILCLTSHDLNGPAQGASLRAGNVFKLLARLGEVHVALAGYHVDWTEPATARCGQFELVRRVRFVSAPPKSLGERVRHDLDPRFTNSDWVQAAPADRAWLEQALAEYDLVWVHGVHLANGFGRWEWPRTVLDIDDIPSEFHRSRQAVATDWKARFAAARQVFLWRRHERLLGERFAAMCVCSTPDRERLGLPEKTFVVPNGFEIPATPPERKLTSPPRVGFIGNFAYEPNRVGMSWFVQNVWPHVRRAFPEARLRLAGARSAEQNWPAGQGIEPLGWLADSAPEIATWSLTVVPVLTGGGTRVKIAEAFSRRCPIVSTSLGAYGYDALDGRELLLADTPEKFAAQCEKILREPRLGDSLAQTAWDKFLQHWTWEAQAGKVAAAAQTVLKAAA